MMNLYQHQQDVLNQTRDKNRVAYYLDMGLGKTFVGAEKMVDLGARVNLLICQKSKINDWLEHFNNHYCIYAYNLTSKKDFDEFIFYAPRSEGGFMVGIINYELAWRRKELLKLKDFTLMLDESSLIQNDSAKQTKFILKLKPSNVILLSGTPTSGKYENLWTQAHLLGWNITKRTYENQYVNYELIDTGMGIKVKVVNKVNPYKNVERLKRKLREHGAVFMKSEEVVNLPQKNFIIVTCPSPKSYKIFMKDNFVRYKNLEFIGTTSLTKRLYARQLASAYNNDKYGAFIDLLESTNDRLIVFYNFDVELDALDALCGAYNRPVSVVNGKRKDLLAYEEKNDSVTLIQYQAGAMGLNLQKANKVIYFSLPERSELFEQSKKRIHRIGQDKPCFYYVLMAKGTIDENIFEALEQKRDFTDELFKEVK